MNELKVVSIDGQLVTDSRDVAEMIKKRHDHLIRNIDGYVNVLNQNPNLGADQFFTQSSYKSGTGKGYKNYLLTRKGCDMVANKMTGEKGVLFTAAYVTKFEEMEKSQQPQTQLEILQGAINQMVAQDQRLTAVEKKQDNINELLSLNPTEWRKKVNSIINKIAQSWGGYQAYRDVRKESYESLEERGKCQLSIRLTNRKRKMALEGVSKSKIDKTSKMDVIADDARLTEIYLAVVKELAIKNDVEMAV